MFCAKSCIGLDNQNWELWATYSSGLVQRMAEKKKERNIKLVFNSQLFKTSSSEKSDHSVLQRLCYAASEIFNHAV